jgi:hypothetical protein
VKRSRPLWSAIRQLASRQAYGFQVIGAALLPEVPTVREAGGTNAPLVERINGDLVDIIGFCRKTS